MYEYEKPWGCNTHTHTQVFSIKQERRQKLFNQFCFLIENINFIKLEGSIIKKDGSESSNLPKLIK